MLRHEGNFGSARAQRKGSWVHLYGEVRIWLEVEEAAAVRSWEAPTVLIVGRIRNKNQAAGNLIKTR